MRKFNIAMVLIGGVAIIGALYAFLKEGMSIFFIMVFVSLVGSIIIYAKRFLENKEQIDDKK